MRARHLGWYARRARKMEPGEWQSRLAGAAEGALDYVRYRLSGKSGYEGAWDPEGFAFCRSTAPLLPEMEWSFEPSPAEADALLAGEHGALGYAWRWRPGGEAWHRAPDTGASWPRSFSDFVSHRPGNRVGDARAIWEPNRLQHFVSLALLARTMPERAEAGVALMKRELLCWAAANPMRRGVNYASAMECALRILSVGVASDLARPLLLRDDAYWSAVAKLVLEHAAFVDRRLSLYSSMGNHTVAECTGLFVAALLFPEYEPARAWEGRAADVLQQAARRTILPDGGPAEQALHYHAQVLDHLEIAIGVGRHFGREVGPLETLHSAGTRFLALFQSDRPSLPRIGDSDDGFALSAHHVPEWTKEARRQAETRKNADLSLETRGGYSIVRSARDDAVLICDHGPLGMPPSFGHGHADALAVELRIRGQPVLIDPGTYAYGADPQLRAYFRSTAAHNTVTVDGRSQARQTGPFLWEGAYGCELLHAELRDEQWAILAARHDGYAELGVTHTRGIHVAAGSIVVLDRLGGAGAHDLTLRWHFAGIVAGTDGAFCLPSLPSFGCVVHGGKTHVLDGSKEPLGGWQSDRYGKRSPISTLCVNAVRHLPHDFVTVFTFAAGAVCSWPEAVLALGDLLDRVAGPALAPREGHA